MGCRFNGCSSINHSWYPLREIECHTWSTWVTLSLSGCSSLDLKEIKSTCRFPESTKPQPLLDPVCHWPLQSILFSSSDHTWSLFLRGRLTTSPQTLVQLLNKIVTFQLSVRQNPLEKKKEKKKRNHHLSEQSIYVLEVWGRWEEIPATITLGHVSDRELHCLVTKLFSMLCTYWRDTWFLHQLCE